MCCRGSPRVRWLTSRAGVRDLRVGRIWKLAPALGVEPVDLLGPPLDWDGTRPCDEPRTVLPLGRPIAPANSPARSRTTYQRPRSVFHAQCRVTVPFSSTPYTCDPQKFSHVLRNSAGCAHSGGRDRDRVRGLGVGFGHPSDELAVLGSTSRPGEVVRPLASA